MTYSIVAKDESTGDLGIVVASRFFAAGAVVPHLRRNCAVATQAFANPLWGVEGANRLAAGEEAGVVLADFIRRDRGEPIRQVHMMDSFGNSVAHTGDQCVEWAGHEIANGVSVAGNMLACSAVVADTMACYLDNLSLDFVDRLLTAMEAGERAGGDKRGRQAAGLRIHRGQDYASHDLRVDDHADPLAELRRLDAVAQERSVHFAKAFATLDNFCGTTDRTELDRAIAEREAWQRKSGYVSRSEATDA